MKEKEKMKNLLSIVVGVSVIAFFPVHAVVFVTNVVVAQREGTKLADITYDVSSDIADTVSVSIVVSNGTEAVNLMTISGDVGTNISTGVGKHILWNGAADWNGNSTTGLNVTVVASDEDFYPVKRFVRYSFTLTNQKGDTIPKAEFWVRAPVAQTSHQKLSALNVTDSYQELADSHGNKTLYFRFDNFPPYGRKIITIKAWVNLNNDPIAISINPSVYLAAADYIEINDPIFRSIAPTFSPGPVDQVAGNIMSWVWHNITNLGYVKTDHGALYALQQRQGDGTEMMYLFVALCRLNGIPARPMMGYICTADAILSSVGSENWAEYFDGEKWQLVDAHDGVFKERGDQYLALCIATDTGPLIHSAKFGCSGEGLTAVMQ